MSDVTRHEMPNGDVCFYRDSDHAYWERSLDDGKCSGRIPGISTVAKCADTGSNDGLLDWASKLTVEGAAREASLGLSLDDPDDIKAALAWMASGERIWLTLQEEKLTWRHIRQEAGERGSQSHDILERLANDEDVKPTNGYDSAVIDWWATNAPKPIHVEAVVYSSALSLAGRFDLMAIIEGERWLLDLKTSKWISPAFFAQLNLYHKAACHAGYPRADRLGIIQVRENGTWEQVECPVRPEWALQALDTYLVGKDLQKAVRAAQKQAQQQMAVAA